MVEIHGLVPAGPLSVDDMDKIDIEAPFEIVDGRLEIMTPPSLWHQRTVKRIAAYLDEHFPESVDDVTLAVGDNGRRPDVVALSALIDDLLARNVAIDTDLVEVAVE